MAVQPPHEELASRAETVFRAAIDLDADLLDAFVHPDSLLAAHHLPRNVSHFRVVDVRPPSQAVVTSWERIKLGAGRYRLEQAAWLLTFSEGLLEWMEPFESLESARAAARDRGSLWHRLLGRARSAKRRTPTRHDV